MSRPVAYSRDMMWFQCEAGYMRDAYSHYDLYSGVGGYWGNVGQEVTTDLKKDCGTLKQCTADENIPCDEIAAFQCFANGSFSSAKENTSLLQQSDNLNNQHKQELLHQNKEGISYRHCEEVITSGICEVVTIIDHFEEVETSEIIDHIEEVQTSEHRECTDVSNKEDISTGRTGEESCDIIRGVSLFRRNSPPCDGYNSSDFSPVYAYLDQKSLKGDKKSFGSPDVLLTTMSKDSRPRKSARLMSRGKSEEDSTVCVKESRKRKAEEDLEEDMTMNKRSKQFRIENHWIPISQDSSITTCTLVPNSHPLTPESEGKASPNLVHGTQFRFRNYLTSSRSSPLPAFSWADSKEVWEVMLKKEAHYVRNPDMFKNHPTLQSRMRTILLDWLIEVCEVYRLHRETFYLSVDFVDRYIAQSKNIQKHQLQLIGITALFIAAKLEEIYPPKLAEFAYVTDGACTETEILDQELVMLKKLNWDLCPLTNIGWLNLYLQVANIEHILELEHGFVFPQYSSHAFIQIARLMDLCILDIGCLNYSYSVLAAASLYHLTSKEIALSVSGFKWQDILPCVNWMAPFATTAREMGPAEMKFFPSVAPEDCHDIQTHAIDLSILEKAQERQEEMLNSLRSTSPDLQAQVITQLTPPHSNKKAGVLGQCDSSPYGGMTSTQSPDC